MMPGDPPQTVLLPPPFSFALPVVGNQVAAAHVSQFPAIFWFKPADRRQPLNEATVWHFETSSIPFDLATACWEDRVLGPYIMGLRLTNAPLPVSMVASVNWDSQAPPRGTTDDTWRLLRTVSTTPDNQGAASLKLLSEWLLPGGYLDPDTKSAVPATWNVTGEFPGFRTHDGSPLQFSAVMPAFANGDVTVKLKQFQTSSPEPLTPVSSMLFNLTDPTLSSAAPARVRLGSLDLTFGASQVGGNTLDATFNKFQFEVDFDPPVKTIKPYNDPLNPGGFIPRIYVKGTLPVASYAPGGQDEPLQ